MRPPQPDEADFVILTGMSGAGRSTVANALEDGGWFVVDNLPPQLLVPLAELGAGHQASRQRPGSAATEALKVVAVVDVRSRTFFERLDEAIAALRSAGWSPRLVFLDAADETLVRRFESTRRPHPLQGRGRLLDGIVNERALLSDLRSEADLIIDTSGINIHQLARKVAPMFNTDRGPALRLAVMSFGFKYGVPLDADFVFDMRFLPNPFWIPELRAHSGRDPQVAAFVLGQAEAGTFVDRVVALMEPVRTGYVREGRRYATIAVGCTGGKHRSVAVAELLATRLRTDTTETFLVHRDLGQE
ncbi:MAG: RNase adapter RapZ [Nostocoides sp.]